MPELTINPTPTPPPNATGNANALSQADAPGRSDGTARTDRESGQDSPFAAVLKSRMDKNSADGYLADKAAFLLAGTETDIGDTTTSVDLSALFPTPEVIPAGAAGVATAPVVNAAETYAAPDLETLPALSLAAGQSPTQVPAALPSAPPVAVLDTRPPQLNVGPGDQASTPSAPPARSDGADRGAGKIALETAINADAARQRVESTPALPASDFPALMERAAAMLHGAASPANGPSSNPTLRIDAPLGQTGWHEEMGQKLTWMAGNGHQQADLVLTPPHLGRVEISLTLNGDQATALFASSNPAVREALENSLHRLREVLADAGVSLGRAEVGSESPNQSARRNEIDFGRDEGVRYASPMPLPGAAGTARTPAGRGMIDVFA